MSTQIVETTDALEQLDFNVQCAIEYLREPPCCSRSAAWVAQCRCGEMILTCNECRLVIYRGKGMVVKHPGHREFVSFDDISWTLL